MQRTLRLHDLFAASQQLGNISPWTLRKHIAQGTVRATRLGRRVFLSDAEIRRIQENGLPPLRRRSNKIADQPRRQHSSALDARRRGVARGKG